MTAVRLLWPGPSSRTRELIVQTVITAVLYVGAAAGLSAIPGYGVMGQTLQHVRWGWLAASAGGVVAAFAGYLLAWRGIASAGGGPSVTPRQRLAVVLVGFGGFVGRGGSAIDRYAFLAAEADEREADVRIAGLDALEHAPLAVACCASAIFLLATGHTDPPPLDFLWPWAVAPAAAAILRTSWLGAARPTGADYGFPEWRCAAAIPGLVWVSDRSETGPLGSVSSKGGDGRGHGALGERGAGRSVST